MKTAPEFNDLMDLPHLRPAFGVNAPAVFRHIVFRIADEADDPLRATSFEDALRLRNQFLKRINASLHNVWDKFGVNQTPFFEDYDTNTRTDEAFSPHQSLLTELTCARIADTEIDLRCWRLRLRIDLHNEYYSVTYILDQQGRPANYRISGSAKRACDYEHELSTPQPWPSQKISQAIRFFYDDLWDAIDRSIGADVKFPGLRFTEFRSFVLRDLNSRFFQIRAARGKFPFAVTDDSDFDDCRTSLLNWLNSNAEFVRGILKFNQSTGEIDQDANCVLCEVIDGNAIYGSSLGRYSRSLRASKARPSSDGPRLHGEAAPLRYFIVYNDLSKYQIGRLIRRTHVLGELRFATAFDVALLHRASARIRALGNYIDQLTFSVSADGTPRWKSTLSDEELRIVQARLAEISASGISGGLAYRVAQSRYYADGFKLFLKEMRVRRIEQWEPYDNFVKRRLYHIFRFISDVGTRYEALSFRVLRLTAAYNAQRLNQFQDNVGALVRQMKTTDEEIRDIQVLGEAIGMAAFAYYGGHIIYDVIVAVIKLKCSQAASVCKESIEANSEIISILSVISALLLLYPLWKLWWRLRRPSTNRTHASQRPATSAPG